MTESIALVLSIVLSTFLAATSAQTVYVTGTFSYAIYISYPGLSQAVQAQCPPDHPQRCDAIQQPNYCCAGGYYCALAPGNAIGCCADGQVCSGAVNGAPTTWYPAATPTVVTVTSYVAGGGIVYPASAVTTTVYGGVATAPPYVAVTTTRTVQSPGCYSTLTANGNGVPTTRDLGNGQQLCVVYPNAAVPQAKKMPSGLVSFTTLLAWLLGM